MTMELTTYIQIPPNLWSGIYATGSAVICNPPVADTDKDFIICATNPALLIDFLVQNGFEVSRNGDGRYEFDPINGITCLRRQEVNIIVTGDYTFYLKFVDATILATKLNLLEKSQRIALFQYVLYGNV